MLGWKGLMPTDVIENDHLYWFLIYWGQGLLRIWTEPWTLTSILQTQYCVYSYMELTDVLMPIEFGVLNPQIQKPWYSESEYRNTELAR